MINSSNESATQKDAPPTTHDVWADLNSVQEEAQRLVAILNDRHPGLMTWNMMLAQRLEKVHALTGKVLGK